MEDDAPHRHDRQHWRQPTHTRILCAPALQAFLGLTFNWGALFGWAAVHGACDWGAVLPLYAAGVCWTLVYDTIYAHQVGCGTGVRLWLCGGCMPPLAEPAHVAPARPDLTTTRRNPGTNTCTQDKADDVKAGIRSTALTFGPRTKAYCAGFGAASTALLAAAGAATGAGPAYYAGVAACAAHLGWQVGTVDLDSPADCHAKFVSNAWFGALLFSGILADRLLG